LDVGRLVGPGRQDLDALVGADLTSPEIARLLGTRLMRRSSRFTVRLRKLRAALEGDPAASRYPSR
jgi:hypothetical protein